MIAVMGATGNTGGRIAAKLLAAGKRVRAIGRSEDKLRRLRDAGAEVAVGDAHDPAFLAGAFDRADAAYTLLVTDAASPDYRAAQDREGEAIVYAIRRSGLRHVVALSCLGADLDERTGIIAGLHAQEERLKRVPGVNLLILRPAMFFENVRDQLPRIQHEGIVADSIDGNLPIPMVATEDIAEVAAHALGERDWQRLAVRELLGPRDITYAEVVRILGERLGKPGLRYVRQTDAERATMLRRAGLSGSFARLYVEMTRAINWEVTRPLGGRTPANTTPTRFEDFAADLVLGDEMRV